MLKVKTNQVESKILRGSLSSSILIESGSFVIDNQWVSYNNYHFRIDEYISSVLSAKRPSFFTDRGKAIALVIALDIYNGINIIEGPEVPFVLKELVPYPEKIGSIPLAGIVLRQDGSSDLTKGYISVSQSDLFKFSGTGNISDKNLMGATGLNNISPGLDGLQGHRGIVGIAGVTGLEGSIGLTGSEGLLIPGEKGLVGMTGISWDVHLPFSEHTF